ncbi:PREDICTED: transcription factor Adf-1-like isoform X2 [Rhagoletis zephyria]|uniref:transcription factor Adf-1-like isoform X2 n=1 Tax=Rhagoletis zephyria TaxID=28612 RepID=UPI000811501D|nr:PREDICTED: transcription factor Adf-1-like isoform X2 [Rhagoletis zephyria]
MEEKLIEETKLHPCLFDKNCHLFRNKMMTERAWQAAAISTGASVEQSKLRWKSQSDRFVREVATQKSNAGSAADENTEWCYLKSTQFPMKHGATRRRKLC